MSNSAVQLSFTLRTSPNVRTVHLLGSWDTYKSQLPLSLVKDAKSGTWRGTFRFQGSNALKLGSRYWYYYIVDGYHVSHDPSKEFTTEKTTGRKLNILDVPGGKTSSSTERADAVRRPTVQTSNTSRHSREIPVGRALSPSKIVHPKPTKAYASRGIREADYERSPIDNDDDLADRFASTRISDRGYDRHAAYASSPSELSDSSSSGPSFSGGSSPSSLSSVSNGSCRCERFGVTRSGQRVKLDCGGARCGYGSSDCSSSEQSSDSESESEEEYRARMRKAEVQREKEKMLEKARSGQKTDRHGKPVGSGGHSSGRRR